MDRKWELLTVSSVLVLLLIKRWPSLNMLILYLRKRSNVFSFFRNLKHFCVSQGILEMVYRSLIESILAFNIVNWFGVLIVRNKARLSRVVNTASKVTGCSQIRFLMFMPKRWKASKVTGCSQIRFLMIMTKRWKGKHPRLLLSDSAQWLSTPSSPADQKTPFRQTF